jgi:hypothetical protein
MNRLLLLAAALAVGSAGCVGHSRRPVYKDCPPDPCAPAAGKAKCTAPCPQSQCETPERIVVQAPKTTFVVEQPCPPPAGAPTPPAGAPTPPAGAPAPAGAPPMMPMGAPMMQMGAPMMPMGMPMGMPMMGAAGPSLVNANVRERNGIGFTLDWIRIPFPCIKPILVNRPSEVTFHMQAQQQQQQSFAPVGFTPMPMTAGYAMPMGQMQMPMMGAGFAPPQVGMVAQPTVQYGQVTYATQVPVGQVPQPPAGAPAPAPPPVGAPAPCKSTADQLLEDCQRQLRESQRRLQELEAGRK